MKTINVTFEDKEFKELTKQKNGKSWKNFILELAEIKEK
jgi:predicted CopG family antitoxin